MRWSACSATRLRRDPNSPGRGGCLWRRDLRAERTQEIGIRMALGAQPAHVLGQMLSSGMSLVSIGVAIGLSGAL